MKRSTSTTLLIAAGLATAFPAVAQQENKPADPPVPPPPAAPGAPAPPADGPRQPAEPRPPRPRRELRDHPPGQPDESGRPAQPPRDGERRRDYTPGAERERDRGGPDGPPRENGDRADRPDRGGERERAARGDFNPERDRAPEMPKKPTPYLGVVTSPAPPALAAQLGLANGFGLLVDEVLPESPAQAAGVQRYDVLKRLNDQQLVEPNQLAALVRDLGKDTEASLTVIRKGQEQKLSIKVGEKLLPEVPSRDLRGPSADNLRFFPRREQFDFFRSDRDGPGAGPGVPKIVPDRLRAWRERMRTYQDEMRKFEDRMREWQKKPDGEAPKLPELPPFPSADIGPGQPDLAPPGGAGQGVRPADLLRELRPGAAADFRTEWVDGASHWDASRARMVMRDHDGEVSVSVKDGHRILTVKKPQGDEVFSGPVDTPEQRNAVPQPYRGKLEALEIRQRPPGPQREGADRPGDGPGRGERPATPSEPETPRVQ